MDIERLVDPYRAPKTCKQCGGKMIFQGVGEYKCEKCSEIAYDDYGLVRCYLETHKGANTAEVEANTGVSRRSIQMMLKESRLQLAEDSKVMLHCESCGAAIREGRFCGECQAKIQKKQQKENSQRGPHQGMHGVGMGRSGESGQKRYQRDR